MTSDAAPPSAPSDSPAKALQSRLSTLDSPLLEWRVHPVRRDPLRLTPVAASALFSAGVAWILFHAPLVCGAAVFMIASATSEYLLPSRFQITEAQAEARCGASHFVIEWPRVRRALLYSDGVRLSPLASPSRLDAFRGVYLRFAPDGVPGDRESVLAAIGRLRTNSTEPSRSGVTEDGGRETDDGRMAEGEA